jgi:hypothetical protein
MPALRFIGLYKALPYREKSKIFTEADYQPAMADQPGLKQGLAWSYYEDANNGFLPYQEIFTYLNTTKVKEVANGLAVNPMQVVNTILKTQKRKEHFALRFEGYFRAPAQAVYTFQAGANNGCRVYVDEKSVIENDASNGLPAGIKSADVPLQAGLHKLTVLYYFGTTGQPKMNFIVEWPGNAGGDGFGWSSHQRLLPLLWCEPSK